VVNVDATTAMEISRVPSRAATSGVAPCSRRRTMLSSTTTALSTSMPAARAMPPSDMMLSVSFVVYMSQNVPTTDTGMATAVIHVARASRRKQ
jgi:hypothetical protein